MTNSDFIKEQKPEHKQLIEEMSKILLKHEPKLNISVANIMGSNMLCFSPTENGVEYRYGFSKHAKHLSFHCMPMYCKPEINRVFSKQFNKTKFKKSCINITDTLNFDLNLFEKLIEECANIKYPF
ncbi:hypothetical protein [uncultured Psychroserpens sp.]|uniref:hypothetical protein n=1 Tax=uncultured Psychroserpens sp. TaxID=255436 RepID=UPI0026295896|nr:hypothetical protein [uncultured Psychroserpens sp.]